MSFRWRIIFLNKNMKKISLILSLGLILLFACTSAATTEPTVVVKPTSTLIQKPTQVITQTPILTQTPSLDQIRGGWSTFYEEKYGLSFLYPAVFDKGFYDQDFLCNVETAQGEDFFEVFIGLAAVRIYETNLSLQEYVDSFIASLSDTNWKLTQYPYSREGNPAIRLEASLEDPPRYRENTYLSHEDIIVVISYTYHPFFDCETKDLNYSMFEVYKQIVNTLKFEKK